MAGEKFYYIFEDAPNKRIQGAEPIGYSEVDFNLDQRDQGMGRDVSLSGGKFNFKFTLQRHGNIFNKILYYRHLTGFESNVKLIIVLKSGLEFIGKLDYVTARSNDFNRFECPVIVESQTQIFRRRSETKVDLFSDVTINGESIIPLQPINMLLQAKPSVQVSKWKQASRYQQNALTPAVTTYFSLTQSIEQSDVADTYVPFVQRSVEKNDMQILESQSALKNVVLKISNMDISIIRAGSNSKTVSIRIIKTSSEVNNATPSTITVYTSGNTTNDVFLTGSFPDIQIGDIQRGEKLWLYMAVDSTGSQSIIINSIEIELSSLSTAYNSITPTFRLIDVMKHVSKSISGLEVSAPRYDLGGQFYDTVLTNGNLLRNVTDKPFYVSWDDLEKSFRSEHNADSEITIENRVFVGIEEDFYTNEECGFFNNTQFSELDNYPNPIYCLNSFNFKYENYQSLKENTEPNSESTIHGQSIFTPYNQDVEGSLELSVKWIRDAILLDVQQRLSTSVSKDTATQDDDKIFAIDTVFTENDQQFTETTTLQHTYANTFLSLKSNGDVNFVVLGIKQGTTFIIEYPDPNAGTYEVFEIANTELKLIRTSGGSISSANDGIRLTKYTYEIKKETIPLTNRTNQGFDVVLNLISPERYSNLRYSVERNIRNYWHRFLATVNLYHKDKPIKNTFYKNNGACETLYNGLRVIEKEDWIPNDPIVTPYMYENVIFANVDFARFLNLQTEIRSRRGFIRTIDNNRRVLKLYPIKMSYENKTRQLTISGQEKFEKAYLTIVKQNGIITINDETKLRKVIYDPVALDRDKQAILFDLEKQRLYNPIYFDKVSVNGAIPETIEVLKSWLDLL